MYLLIRLVSTFQTTYITTGHPNTRIDFVWFRAEYCLSFLSHLVFSLAASLLVLHWLVSLWVCLSSPGWSFVDPGDQVRWEVLETVPHLRKKEMFNAGNWFLSLIHSFISFFLFKAKLTADLVSWGQKSYVREGDPSSVPIIKLHHHTALLLLLTRTSYSTTHTGRRTWVAGVYKCVCTEWGCRCVSLTSVDISRVKAAGALAPVGTNSRPCRQDGLGLGSHV